MNALIDTKLMGFLQNIHKIDWYWYKKCFKVLLKFMKGSFRNA